MTHHSKITDGPPALRPIFGVAALTAILSLSLFFLALFQGWLGPFARKGSIFCEAMRPGLIKQPANTWSNLGFVAAGLVMAWTLSSGRFQQNRNALTRSPFTGACFCILVVLLGPGSMAMHASGTRLGAFFDNLAMYFIAAFLVAYSARRLFRLATPLFAVVFAAVLASDIWASRQPNLDFILKSPGNAAFLACICVTIVFETINCFIRRIHRTQGWGYASVGVVALAFFIWNMSLTGRPWCVRNSLIQGHAIWHLLDALSIYCLFRYYVSEREETDSPEVEPGAFTPYRSEKNS